MKKIAVLYAEFDTDVMIDEKDLKEQFNNDWLTFMQYLYNEEGIGMFDELELVNVIDKDNENEVFKKWLELTPEVLVIQYFEDNNRDDK